ncbi:MAG: hypothetical protein WC803_01760 [Sphingomonas sp.]
MSISGLLWVLAGAVLAFGAALPVVPADVAAQLPAEYDVLASVQLSVKGPGRTFQIIALGRRYEGAAPAPARPLIIFERRGGRYISLARNDHVILRADEGGQCDPFLDGDATIAARGRFFTVENGVACGQHWADYVTFRLDDKAGFVFDNERVSSWSINTSNAPDADALVQSRPPRVKRDEPGKLTAFAAWRRGR